MTRPPDYIRHQVNERDTTIDWFFAHGRDRRQHRQHRLRQLALMIAGWAFAVLPVVITASALTHPQGGGWWYYQEGFQMWDVTVHILGILLAVFVIGFLALYLVNRASSAERGRRTTYDAERLSRRLELAGDMYQGKYGDRAFRVERSKIVIQPYEDIETYELRDLYRTYGVN